ncbi:MAG: hypothetical protein HY210_00650 [Candidatus Omnitrophica bacterium]|nr:hypothetical protein [Candidatus Omnitrophota bacterium]
MPNSRFLLSLFQKSIDDKTAIKILKVIESFMLRRHICEYRTAELDDIFPKLAGIGKDTILSEVKNQLNKHFPGNQEFKDKMAVYNFGGHEDRAKYVLEQFEYNIIGDQGEYE